MDRLPLHRYVAAALVRHARLWLAIAFAGALTGLCTAALPQPSEVSTSLLLSHRPDDEPSSAMLTDVRLSTSRSVAERVVTRLRLPTTPDELLKRYEARAVSNRVLELTVAADSRAEATRQAEVLAATVLEYRLEQARAQLGPVRRQLAAARTRVEHLTDNAVPTITATGAAEAVQREQLARTERQIAGLQRTVAMEDAALRQVRDSRVLDRAEPVEQSKLAAALSGVAYGFAGGLGAGVVFVLLRTALGGPLWQRQAISQVLGAPVTASVGRVGRKRWWHEYLARLPWPSDADWLRLAVDELRDTVERQRSSKPTLLVVPVDCTGAAALVVATLATEYAQDGRRTLVADLSRRHRLARALGVRQLGTSPSPLAAAADRVIVHLPEPGDGHRGRLEPDVGHPAGYDVLRIEWAVAEVVLSFADARPADGADHLSSWSTRAVAVVSASWASATRTRAASDVVRSAGLRLESAILVSAHHVDRLLADRHTGRAHTTTLSS